MDLHPAQSDSSHSGLSRTGSKPFGIALWISGWLLSLLGLAMSLGMLLYLGYSGRTFSWEYFLIFPSMLAGGAVVHCGQLLRLNGRRRLAKIAPFPADGDVFVLYLRAFYRDAEKTGLERSWLRPEALMSLPHLGTFFFSGHSIEEHLISSLRGLGPVIAVGIPGEPLPPAGARRLYMPQDGWEEPVKDLMSRARMVVIALDPRSVATPGGTDGASGLVWEFLQATRIVPPERLLFVAPETEEAFDLFRAEVASALRGCSAEERASVPELPEFRPAAREFMNKERSSGGLITYSTDWAPSFSPLPPAFPLYDVLRARLRGALRPVKDRLAAYEDGLPQANDPGLQDWRRRAELIALMRTVLLVLFGFELVSATLRLGLPKGIGEWSLIVLSFLFTLLILHVTGKMARDARIRSVPPPGGRGSDGIGPRRIPP
ncbi:hypothetical protein [Actinomadura sp. NPDC000600]|uniref:hypothetical protein n=1 Tax=Actinomadura sp. NPDC000600 TaxID=3154262 RepID=UPI0033974BF7